MCVCVCVCARTRMLVCDFLCVCIHPLELFNQLTDIHGTVT